MPTHDTTTTRPPRRAPAALAALLALATGALAARQPDNTADAPDDAPNDTSHPMGRRHDRRRRHALRRPGHLLHHRRSRPRRHPRQRGILGRLHTRPLPRDAQRLPPRPPGRDHRRLQPRPPHRARTPPRRLLPPRHRGLLEPRLHTAARTRNHPRHPRRHPQRRRGNRRLPRPPPAPADQHRPPRRLCPDRPPPRRDRRRDRRPHRRTPSRRRPARRRHPRRARLAHAPPRQPARRRARPSPSPTRRRPTPRPTPTDPLRKTTHRPAPTKRANPAPSPRPTPRPTPRRAARRAASQTPPPTTRREPGTETRPTNESGAQPEPEQIENRRPQRPDLLDPATLDALERAFQRARNLPRDELDRSLDELRAEYTRALSAAQDEALERALRQRLEWIDLRIETRDQRRAIDRTLARIDEQTEALADRIAAWREGQTYRLVGRLTASSVYTGDALPLLYRVRAPDPNTGIERTIGYVAPRDGQDLRIYLGDIVGVAGEPVRDDALRVTVVHADRIQRLE